MKTLKNAIVFADGKRASLTDLIRGQYDRLEVLYEQENGTWNIMFGKLDGDVFISNQEEFKLQFKGETELPQDYNYLIMYFAEKTDGEPALSGLPCIGSLAEVVAHFWNHKKTPIRMVGMYFGSTESKRKNGAFLNYPLTIQVVDANEFGFYDETGRFWKIADIKNL